MILAVGSLLTNSTVTGLLPFLAWGIYKAFQFNFFMIFFF